jgi:hypothetical protein
MTVTDLNYSRTREGARREPTSNDPRVAEIDEALATGRYLEWADKLTEERSRLLAEAARKILAA